MPDLSDGINFIADNLLRCFWERIQHKGNSIQVAYFVLSEEVQGESFAQAIDSNLYGAFLKEGHKLLRTKDAGIQQRPKQHQYLCNRTELADYAYRQKTKSKQVEAVFDWSSRNRQDLLTKNLDLTSHFVFVVDWGIAA